MTPLAFLDIGFGEMVVVAFVALLLFGGRLPEVMRNLGASYRNLKRGMDDLSRSALRPDQPIPPRQPPARPEAPVPPPTSSERIAKVTTGPAPLPSAGSAPALPAPVPPSPAPTKPPPLPWDDDLPPV